MFQPLVIGPADMRLGAGADQQAILAVVQALEAQTGFRLRLEPTA